MVIKNAITSIFFNAGSEKSDCTAVGFFKML